MQTRFIGITMKPLVNKLILVIFLIMSFISCSHIAHIAYNEDYISSQDSDGEYSEANPAPRKREYKKIYCTSEDKKKGIKATIDYLHVACGLSRIQPIDNRTLEIKRIVLGVERLSFSNLLLGHHLLILKIW